MPTYHKFNVGDRVAWDHNAWNHSLNRNTWRTTRTEGTIVSLADKSTPDNYMISWDNNPTNLCNTHACWIQPVEIEIKVN